MRNLKTPLTQEVIQTLAVGELITLSGTIYTARDAAHIQLCDTLQRGSSLPFQPEGAVIFYAGPAPAPPDEVIGSIGPTTSGRMDPLTVPLLEAGVRGLIGKGSRDSVVTEGITRTGSVYFTAIGGIAALLQSCIVSAEVIAYPELGTEAVRKLEVENFPLEVALL